MQQPNSNSKTTSANTDLLDEKDRSKFLTQLEIPLIMFILKKLSCKERPLSASKVSDYMNLLTKEQHSEKTILRKLKNLCLLQNDVQNELINNTLFLTFGGYVIETGTGKNSAGKKPQSRFYFSPLLDAGDLALICGTIASNRYLTEQEKAYLLSREQTLSVADADTVDFTKNLEDQHVFPESICQKPQLEKVLSTQAVNLLHHVNQLYDAIEQDHQIQLIYGIYDMADNGTRHIKFRPRNTDNPYTLNPYALLWNGGAYYLLATHDGHDNPVHFRVDRIISIKTVTEPDDATKPIPRAALPDSLKPFFHKKGKNQTFLPEKYTAVYPLMGIYDEANCMDCHIECTADTLSILIDAFGSKLTILPSPLPHEADEVNFHGQPQRFFMVQLRHVQYDNVKQFCLQQHASITALHPRQLVEDIEKDLQAALSKYQKVLRTT